MSRILLDENMPFGLRRMLPGHDVQHVTDLGWDGISNGTLLAAAEQEQFEILVAADRNLRYQQNMAVFRLAIISLSTNRWKTIRQEVHLILEAIDRARPGAVLEVRFGSSAG